MDLVKTLDWKKLQTVLDSIKSDTRQNHGTEMECEGCRVGKFFAKNDKPLHTLYAALVVNLMETHDIQRLIEDAVRSGFVLAWQYRNTVEFEKAFQEGPPKKGNESNASIEK